MARIDVMVQALTLDTAQSDYSEMVNGQFRVPAILSAHPSVQEQRELLRKHAASTAAMRP
jgi:hypothetical protein